MADYTPSRPGEANLAGGDAPSAAQATANYLKLFSGETLAAHRVSTVMRPLHRVRNLKSGKSAQFMVSGRVGAVRHKPGVQLTGNQKLPYNEIEIFADYPLVADTFIGDWDTTLSHFETRNEHAVQLGDALSQTYDQTLLRLAVKGAAMSNVVAGLPGGSLIKGGANMVTDLDTIRAAHFSAAQTFAEKSVPMAERHSVMSPMQYYILAQDTTLMNKDWGGAGNYAKAEVPVIAGINIHMSNNVPGLATSGAGQNGAGGPTAATFAQVDGEINDYSLTATNTVGVIFQREALGTVSLWDVQIKAQEDISRGGTLTLARMLTGHGVLRPECCIELRKDS